MFKLVISDDEGKTTAVPLVREEITIGRKEGNTIRLTDRNVSRRHARLQKQNGHYLLHDLGSYNGVLINGIRLSEARPLQHGDQILIGDYKLAIMEEAQTAPSTGSEGEATTPNAPVQVHPAPTAPGTPSAIAAQSNGSASPAPPAPIGAEADTVRVATPVVHDLPASIRDLRLVFLSPAGVPAPMVLDRLPLVMGRSEVADIALPFPSISREHARLINDDGRLGIEDMGSQNGLLVNGKQSSRAVLAVGDLVTIGVVELRVARRGEDTVMIHQAGGAGRRSVARNAFMALGACLVLGGATVFVLRSRENAPALTEAPPAAASTVTAAMPSTPVAAVQPAPAAVPAPTPAVVASAEAPESSEPATPDGPDAPPDETAPPVRRAPAAASEHHSARPERTRATARTAGTTQLPAMGLNTPSGSAASSSSGSSPATAGASGAPAAASAMDEARACLSRGDSQCVIDALRGHAQTEPELATLASSYRSVGNRGEAVRTMQRYLSRFPAGPRAEGFRRYVDADAP